MATKSELAWAAGLFEGEGCITVSHGRSPKGVVYPQARLKLNSVDEDVVREFHRIVKLGWFRVDLAPERRGWQRQYEWGTGAKVDVQKVLHLLLPWLKSRRRARAEEILSR